MSPLLSSAVQLTMVLLRLAGMFLIIRLATAMFRTTGSMLRSVSSLTCVPLIANVILVIVVGVPAMIGAGADIPNIPSSYAGGTSVSVIITVRKQIVYYKAYR